MLMQYPEKSKQKLFGELAAEQALLEGGTQRQAIPSRRRNQLFQKPGTANILYLLNNASEESNTAYQKPAGIFQLFIYDPECKVVMVSLKRRPPQKHLLNFQAEYLLDAIVSRQKKIGSIKEMAVKQVSIGQRVDGVKDAIKEAVNEVKLDTGNYEVKDAIGEVKA
ncbi:hypothetical protein FGO68_gene12282 [Halteria grandinella]|uniref:Uncharacterized protein n=1 Tax=Halteria grandinella TaxID=5974 RepID=A0A8J8NK09_HALGN|nr:hypothetical protein FGO68_gene12282 [Halteria grandinella]